MAGSPLNRFSFLRTDHAFLSAAIAHPSTSFLLMRDLAPLSKDPRTLGYVSLNDVRSLIGSDPYAKSEEDLMAEYNSSKTIPLLIFLGLDEQSKDGLAWEALSGCSLLCIGRDD